MAQIGEQSVGFGSYSEDSPVADASKFEVRGERGDGRGGREKGPPQSEAAGWGGKGLDIGHGREGGRDVRGPEISPRVVEPDGQDQLGGQVGHLLNLQVALFPHQIIQQRAKQEGSGIYDLRFTTYEY